MCKYKMGDIVWGTVPYVDGSGFKMRPLIILKIQKEICKYFVVECYSLLEKHYEGKKGIWIKTNHEKFTECGFENDTFIHCKIKTWILEKFIRPHPQYGGNPMGFCSFIDEIENYS